MRPVKLRPAAVCVLAACCCVRSAGADIDAAEYETRTHLRDGRSQDRMRRQIEVEREAEARRAAERDDALRQAEAGRLRAEAARPWPERLTEQRCTSCHAARNYLEAAHTAPFWWGVALRMKWVNGAPVGWDELAVIVPQLHAQRPAGGMRAVIEWASIAALLVAPAAVYGVQYRLRRWWRQGRQR